LIMASFDNGCIAILHKDKDDHAISITPLSDGGNS
jgi:hypothetical protein